MKARVKHNKQVGDLNAGIKEGDIVDVTNTGYDEVFGEDLYYVEGKTLRLPLSDLELLE